MRRLIVIRHAIAEKRDVERWPNDDERPLTNNGAKQFKRAARGLAKIIGTPDEMLASPLMRAQQTAEILNRDANFPAPTEFAELRPETDRARTIEALAKRHARRIAIVGHEPSLSRLIAELLKGAKAPAALRLKKGSLAILEFDRRISKGAGRLIALVPPRFLRAVR